MGMTHVVIRVRKNHEAKKFSDVDFLVDSGGVYTVIDGALLRSLGCKPYRTRNFFLANGTKISREIGDAYFEYAGVGGPAPVVFGKKGDANLLGATALESLELVLEPFKRELRPMTMTLMGAVPYR